MPFDDLSPDMESRKSHLSLPPVLTSGENLPPGFPLDRWNTQAARYQTAWDYYTGRAWLEEENGAQSEGGGTVLKYPLRVNPFSSFAQKHAFVIIGEVPDTDDALVRTEVSPAYNFEGKEVSQEDRDFAQNIERLVNHAWSENHGRALQAEAALLTAFLGGVFFKVTYDPLDALKAVPVRIEMLIPDFVLPVWDTQDYYNLLEVYVTYRIPGVEAKSKYGVDVESLHCYYVEHWTKDMVSIYIDGTPITYNGVHYKNYKHGYGFVPFVYLPRLRAGGFYGRGFLQDILGLSEEFNARLADTGDAISETVHRDRYVSNMTSGSPRKIDIGNGRELIDLGTAPPGGDAPEITTDDPPSMSEGLVKFPETLWKQLLRSADLSDIVFGEDEGSQRSALTLAFRMWPMTSLARQTRIFWTEGLNVIARMVLTICAIKSKLGVPRNVLSRIRTAQNWAPMIPRDREQEVNETVLMFSAKMISLENALTRIGDVKDIPEEIERVRKDREEALELESKYGDKGNSDEMDTPPGVQAPVAEAITGDG